MMLVAACFIVIFSSFSTFFNFWNYYDPGFKRSGTVFAPPDVQEYFQATPGFLRQGLWLAVTITPHPP
jgi:hypothetical protein